jgi:carbamoyl-phosphate synthase large subunit
MEMNINRVLNWLILAAEFKAKTLILLLWGWNWKSDGTRYVDNESIVTDKKKIIVLAQGQIELGKELNLIHAYTEFLAKSVWIRNDYD